MRIKHTPGPWRIVGNGIFTEGKSTNIAVVSRMNFGLLTNGAFKDDDERDANIKLIAASPTMLQEMLRYLPILEYLEKNEPECWASLTQGTGIATLNGYREAIKKAGGQL